MSNNMEEFKSQKIKNVIKTLLKKKGFTYESVAEHMECSVPTIKRILGPEELTVNRLLQFCDLVDIDLADLEALSQTDNDERESFTEDQEQFLSKNKNYFSYLLKLFSGETPKQIADANKLTQRSTDKYLIGLEKLGLIRVTGKQRIKTSFKQTPSLGRGILAKVYFESFITGASSFFINLIHESILFNGPAEEKPKAKFGIQAVKVSKASYEAWITEQDKAIRNFEKLARYEEKIKDPSELMTAVIVDACAIVKNDYKGLKTIENAMGDITNL